MIDKECLVEWAGLLSKKERMILSTYEGSNSMPEYMDRFWNVKALENLIAQGFICWTLEGYQLSRDGEALARYIENQERCEL
ncbi:MAG: hypothetical protein RBR20_04735 [Desulfobacterales bacterium]|jgi:hypothetical protein|nr:hypothetical protein [Desulfobacterales bacterium]